jgi:hypothetical protein
VEPNEKEYHPDANHHPFFDDIGKKKVVEMYQWHGHEDINKEWRNE